MADFEWLPDRRRYRDAATGRFVAAATVRRLRDAVVAHNRERLVVLADALIDGSMTLQAFEREARVRVKRAWLAEYLLGRGGRNAMTARDRGLLGALLREQYGYLRGFAEAAAAGELTPAMARSRLGLYAGSARAGFERGRAAAYSPALSLPAYPGDGNQSCLGNCRCAWRIEERVAEWRCTWTIDAAAEHCDDCRANADRWAPLVVAKAE